MKCAKGLSTVERLLACGGLGNNVDSEQLASISLIFVSQFLGRVINWKNFERTADDLLSYS